MGAWGPSDGDLQPFVEAWAREFSRDVSAGDELRALHHDRWFRIHSLPRSKRHPESEAEYAELLHRHNALLDALFGPGARVVLVVPQWGGDAAGPPPPKRVHRGGVGPAPARAPFPAGLRPLWRRAPRDEYEGFTYLFGARFTWRAGAADAMLRYVAGDWGRFLLASEAADRVYAPYDGGADVILPPTEDPAAWETRYAAWLPDDRRTEWVYDPLR